ncbi:MAG TPA: hypothetical protein VKB88_19885 [Bryobacteraceae bacterium]|nr:hypothetical protein [Bryobacteraceae bacterium]
MPDHRIPYIFTCLTALLLSRPAIGSDLRLSVRVCNFSSANNVILFQAEAIARRIFQDAGIDTDWTTAGDPRRLNPSILTVQILPGRSQRYDLKDAFGVAMNDKKAAPFLADVFFGVIGERAATQEEEALILGHVMAHEVGHLLLGVEHTPATIMAGELCGRDLPLMRAGRMRFSKSQSDHLRTAVARRQQGR